MNLKSVGYFKEMSDGNPNNPSIKDYINKGADYPVEKICAYLDSGLPLIVSPGFVLDVIDESKGNAGSPSILTDGKWVWSGVLSYYVKNYNLQLDSELIDTMISNGWKIPIHENELDYSSILIDGEPLL
ncbi:MAG: hypothetical protein J5844_01735 [Clostridia bacterium]|nr:hypothetical protein [Clostridia bacterium]